MTKSEEHFTDNILCKTISVADEIGFAVGVVAKDLQATSPPGKHNRRGF